MRYLKLALMFFAAASCEIFAAVKPAVYNPDTNVLLQPSSAEFAAANKLVTNEVLCVRVANMFMMKSGSGNVFYTDAELKVLNKYGATLYTASTVWRDRSYHAGYGIIDSKVKIYYYISGANPDTGVCAKPKKLLVQSGSADYSSGNSIASVEGLSGDPTSYATQITCIEFYPDLSGTLNGKSIREIFLDPENTIIVSRKNPTQIERGANGERIWWPVVPQYYRAIL